MTPPPTVPPWPCCCLWQRGPCVSCGSSLPGGSAQRCCWRWLYWWPLGCHELARLARQRAQWQGFAGMVRKACPGLARVDAAGMARSGRNGQAGRAWQAWQARCGEIWTGRAWQAWLRRHGLARPVLAGKAWSSVEGKARLARCGRASARHGGQGLVGTSGGAWQAR